jgi:hypothetical protein
MSPKLRFSILHRDGFTCRYCGAAAPDVKLQVDHVHPIARGGVDDPANLVTACEACNQGKRDSGLVVLPWQRQMAVLGLMLDAFLAPMTEYERHPLAQRFGEISDFALAPDDPAYLWNAVKDAEDWDEAVKILRRIEFGEYDA